ncbi:hypothetical protein [Sunxiuqinia elliptica]|uniref:Enamine deaminase RidA (YjgF/YER057c/UK114 family) n=1 Tax=Sunxiuqinia elliptica TaxID=655355 RepID=A0A4R6GLB7_9BACT|nr:hypothetical protein [Sunxiuqinia elliptica]TDN95823.1 enamine deaminase RidA (YjgF/YER057c/UK114 family) [Sunxiuqinia elliptica]TDO67765.1 enamine deaminase RidA (YjgF/YER057c/UK114 family) [Sunxiuqinia elliptica]
MKNDVLLASHPENLKQFKPKPYYWYLKPTVVGDFIAQLANCINALQRYLEKHEDEQVFMLRVFVRVNTKAQLERYIGEVKKTLERFNGPYTIIAEAPELPSSVEFEVGTINTTDVELKYGETENLRYTQIQYKSHTEYWFEGAIGQGGNTMEENSKEAFEQLQRAFASIGLSFDAIVRQWNYIEDICGLQEVGAKKRQNYQQFNDVRATYYKQFRKVDGFPAATGIGQLFGGVIVECMLVDGYEGCSVFSVKNQSQEDAYCYSQQVLVGDSIRTGSRKQVPQFERAKLMRVQQKGRLFISGTAAIIGQNTVDLNDVVAQTKVIINHLKELIYTSASYYEANEFEKEYIAYLRCYVKHQADIPVVRDVCLRNFNDVPMSFVVADICRRELLVEIEAEVYRGE